MNKVYFHFFASNLIDNI